MNHRQRLQRQRVNQSSSGTFVNAYEETQEYGGSEEGGWYYRSGYPLQSVKVPRGADRNQIEAIRTRLEKEYEDYDFGRYSELRVRVESHPAQGYPRHRPRYE